MCYSPGIATPVHVHLTRSLSHKSDIRPIMVDGSVSYDSKFPQCFIAYTCLSSDQQFYTYVGKNGKL